MSTEDLKQADRSVSRGRDSLQSVSYLHASYPRTLRYAAKPLVLDDVDGIHRGRGFD